jgi:uncharacterized protein YqjF (DUF2071 family)
MAGRRPHTAGAARPSPSLTGALRGLKAAVAAAVEIGRLPPADHRPWPPPDDPWIMKQTWRNLLFAHWPLPARVLRPLVPAGLQLETFEAQAWLGITPFVLTGLRPRAAPAIPGVSEFPEINVRTYVTAGGKPGVFFFSLDAGSMLAVTGARLVYSLPYFRAMFALRTGARDSIVYGSRRTHRGAPRAEFSAEYRPTGEPSHARKGTLAHWLTERYCLYAVDRRGGLHRAEIHHPPWLLQPAEARIQRNTMTQGLGIELPDVPPLLHFSKHLDVHVWAPHSLRATPARRRPPAARTGTALA